MQIIHVVGARPNFMKVAPVMTALSKCGGVVQTLIHTGQHYDTRMSEVFFQQLGLPQPDVNLEVGSGSHAVQTAQIMMRFEEVVIAQKPDLVLVYGDVNSTVAATLVCAKLGVPVGHVEAGLRSFDRTMPEEINRLLTDQIADLLFTPSADGDQNLLREGVAAERIHLVGNVMIDTLTRLLPAALARWPEQRATIGTLPYALVTLHRPSNVDDSHRLPQIMDALDDISYDIPVIFPVHPRTRQHIRDNYLQPKSPHLQLIEPVGYLDFLSLQYHARLIITDSGGIQEESTYLGIPCLTLRENTERPITVIMGTNILVGQNTARLRSEVDQILSGKVKEGQSPPLWDGKASERIAQVIVQWRSDQSGLPLNLANSRDVNTLPVT